jgi:AraC family transcriptional regulator
MNEQGTLQVSPRHLSVGADYLTAPRLSSPVIFSRRSPASASERIGVLVRCAMTHFDSNRATAWRCLRDASTLLDAELEGSGVPAPPWERTLQAGGLATWQARRVLEYIEANLGSKLATQEISSLVPLSKSHFSRAFKQTLGLPPMTYVAMRRVERVKVMMTSTRERITDIALACGFADQSHLNRCFRRLVGISPGLWRRRFALPAYEPRGVE